MRVRKGNLTLILRFGRWSSSMGGSIEAVGRWVNGETKLSNALAWQGAGR
jgi:hypothetical protein